MKQITISGVIGWDATVTDLRQQLQEANGAPVEIIISSPGGFVSDGLEMFNLVRNYSGETIARLSGFAMSMASYIPLAADRIIAEDNAIYMIHNVRGGVFGDHNDILSYGATTKGMSRLLAKAYARRTGKDLAAIEKMMDAETYLFGDEMVDHGFVDELITTDRDKDPETARAMACVAFSECATRMSADIGAVKQDLAACATILATAVTHSPENQTNKENVMDLKKLKAEHPELVAAIADEALAQFRESELQAARMEGAESERQRIIDCHTQLGAGHDALVTAMALDGKSSAADIALAITTAEKALRNQAQQNLEDDAPPAAPPAEDGGVSNETDDDVTEEASQARYSRSAALQKEFGSFAAYFAYLKASASGRVKILNK